MVCALSRATYLFLFLCSLQPLDVRYCMFFSVHSGHFYGGVVDSEEGTISLFDGYHTEVALCQKFPIFIDRERESLS